MKSFRYEKNGETKFIHNATLYKGKVVQIVGKNFKPYFNSQLITPKIKDKLSSVKYITATNEADLLPYMLILGENEGGGIMIDVEEERNKVQQEKNLAIKAGEISIKLGYSSFGLGVMILDRIPPDLFAKVKPYASYFAANEDDMEFIDDQYGYLSPSRHDLKGWYYKFEAIDILNKSGVKMVYDGFTVTDIASFHDAVEKAKIKYEEQEKAQNELKRLKAAYKNKINELPKEYVTKEEANQARLLPRIQVLDFTGANVYGGGKWLHLRDDGVGYVVINNGMDGDNWALNNYETGGAGAICYRVQGLKEILEEIKNLNL